ncbi:MAG: sigma-70 family RNA polymerase sigma factor [Bacteroidales bacterium]|nr:sigma-70 family RNA polymerase sigma factor [Candidatus Cryptobacteroides caccocaballi]
MTREEFDRTWLPLANGFYKVAYYLLESEAEAKDAVQEVFVKLWTTRDKIEHVLNPKSYGTMMVRNICIDIIRKAERMHTESIPESLAAPPPDQRRESQERLKATEEAMKELPELQQKILRMRVWGKMEFDEIADELGISQVNVRVQLSRARKRLKEQLEKDN